MRYFYSNEIVFRGHPDKVADQISDALLDAYLEQDKGSRCGIEVVGGKGKILITGEVTSTAKVDVVAVTKRVLKDIGYSTEYEVIDNIGKQSRDIAQGVDIGGAGDQGLCIKKGTLIATKVGYKPIEDVKIGDFVLTSTGKFERVYGAQKTGFLKTIKITTNYGRELLCTPNHKIFTKEQGFIEATNTKSLTLNTDCSGIIGDYTNSIKLTQDSINPHGGKVSFRDKTFELNTDIAYLMGCLIGDGDITEVDNIKLTAKKFDKLDTYRAILEKLFGNNFSIRDFGFVVYSVGIRKFLFDLGLDYWKSVDKQVPFSIFKSNKDIQKAFLQGLFDSDGCVSKNKHHSWHEGIVSYSSISRLLISQVALLLRNLGINCTEKLHSTPKKSTSGIELKHNCYIVKLDKYRDTEKFNSIIGFNVPYKKEKLVLCLQNHQPLYYKDKPEIVVSITEDSEYDVYDLSVENTPEFYANGVLVHNCFGYACKDTVEYLPTAVVILQEFSRFYDELCHNDKRFLPDGKAQITGKYEDGKLYGIKDFVISYQNCETDRENTDKILKEKAVEICSHYGIVINEFHINPTGKFLIGGFEGDAGLTGRKIVVDGYQSFAKVGGGAQSGKDPTKVDRSAAYKARQLAIRFLKNSKIPVEWCEIQLSYAIGLCEPLAIYAKTDKGSVDLTQIYANECTPLSMINDLDLKNVKYEETAKFGHFGNKQFNWEK